MLARSARIICLHAIQRIKKQSPKLVDNLVDETYLSHLDTIFPLKLKELPIF
tara:strand:+ start:894 stop:1049 length:156 start_codon:yes stop_codon:yes gene_type:complete